MEFAVARGPHAEWPAISEQIYTALQAVLLGEKAPDQAMKDAASTVNKILGE
jgi:multiple sugar transport system substrate-binding protein